MNMSMKKSSNNETCVYTGRRLNGSKGSLQRFEMPNGEEAFYKRIKGVYIGHTYECSKDKMSIRPTQTDAERIDNPEWDAADALVDASNARKRAQKKCAAKTSPAFKNAIAAITPLCKGLGYIERRYLIELLVDKVTFKKGKIS
jgi:hypothetical protein